MNDILNPSPSGGELETGTTGAGVDATKTVETSTEFNPDTADNLSQVRDWGKSLKADLDKIKPAHEFVTSSFGDLENAKIAADVYGQFAGEEFDAEKFTKLLESLSPQRSQQLFEKFASSKATELSQKEIEKIFGGKVTPEEVRLFKQFKENGYGLGQGEDIPEALKFNADGTPKSDEEIQFYRDLQRQIKEKNENEAASKQAEEQAREAERQSKIAEAVDTFSNDRLKILNDEFKTYGLTDTDGDTTEAREEKNFIRQFIINGVSGAFISSEGARDYHTAVEHLKNGEGLLARRYEARIEKGLLDIMRSKPLSRLLSSLTKADSDQESRPEISKSGTSTGDEGDTSKKKETQDEFFARLVREGKIKL